MSELEIYETNPPTIGELEVCDDFFDENFYDQKLDDSDKSDELRESRE